MKQPSSIQPYHPHPAPRKGRFAISSLALAALLLVSTPDHLSACSFHVGVFGNTLSKQIANSIEIVVMRPSTQNPFQFVSVEQLKGMKSDSIPSHLVDSSARHGLAPTVNHALLYARGLDGRWTQLMLLDEVKRRIAEKMLAYSNTWATPSGAAEKRDYFAALLSHPRTDIQYIALRELDAMSYEILKDGVYPVMVGDLLSGIMDLQSMALTPIKILLLGIIGGEDAERAAFQQLQGLAASRSALNLGAWITAAIETAGLRGIDRLGRVFLDPDVTLTRQQLLEIVRALSVQSRSARSELRVALDSAVQRLVNRYQEAAPMVAQVFVTTSDWSQVNLVRDLISTNAFSNRSDLKAAVAYVSRVGEARSSRPHPLIRTDMPFKSPPPNP